MADDDALRILKKRYANGEISRKKYLQEKRDLEDEDKEDDNDSESGKPGGLPSGVQWPPPASTPGGGGGGIGKIGIVSVLVFVIIFGGFLFFLGYGNLFFEFLPGLFSSTTTIPQGSAYYSGSCNAYSGFNCTNPSFSTTTGYLNFTLGQSTGATLYNIELTCVAANVSSASSVHFYYFVNRSTQNSTFIRSGGTTYLSGLPCVSPYTGRFYGYILLNYTDSQAQASMSNTWHTARVALLNVTLV